MNKAWKPKVWLAVLLALFLQPFAFLYLHRPNLFFTYLLSQVVLSIVIFYFNILIALLYAFTVICCIHAYLIAKNYSSCEARKWYSRWWGVLIALSVFLVPVFLCRAFLLDSFRMEATSMSPNFEHNDILIVKKYGYGSYGAFDISLLNKDISDNTVLQRGKVYAYNPPFTDENMVFVGRLIAKPGDTIEIEENRIRVNNLPLQTTLISKNADYSLYQEESDDTAYQIKITNTGISAPEVNLTIAKDDYFFLGDKRNRSNESRYWGTVDSTNIIGEVVYVFD